MSTNTPPDRPTVSLPVILTIAATLVFILAFATVLLITGHNAETLLVILAAAAPALGTLFLGQQILTKTKSIETNTNGTLKSKDQTIAGLQSALAVATNPTTATTVAIAAHNPGGNPIMQTDANGNIVVNQNGNINPVPTPVPTPVTSIVSPPPAPEPAPVPEAVSTVPTPAEPVATVPEPVATVPEPVVLTNTYDDTVIVDGITYTRQPDGTLVPRPSAYPLPPTTNMV